MTAQPRPPRHDDTTPADEALRTRAYRELGGALDRIPFQRAHLLILVLVASGALFDAIEQYNVGLAAPLIAREWDLSNSEVGLLTTLTFAGMAVGSLIAGVTGDPMAAASPTCTTSPSTPSAPSWPRCSQLPGAPHRPSHRRHRARG